LEDYKVSWQEQAREVLGYHWIVTLAHMTDFSKRTVQRWRTGELQIPEHVVEQINETYNIWIALQGDKE